MRLLSRRTVDRATANLAEPNPLASQLATELSRLRQRGLDHVDDQWDRKRPVDSPIIDELAGVAGLTYRAGRLAGYLGERLDAYRSINADGANFIRRLFFDKRNNAPGPGRATGLLATVRGPMQLEASTFRRIQRQHFTALAVFLLDNPTPPTRTPRRYLVLAASGVLLATAGAISLVTFWPR